MISLYADGTSRGDSAEHCQDKTTKTMMTVTAVLHVSMLE